MMTRNRLRQDWNTLAHGVQLPLRQTVCVTLAGLIVGAFALEISLPSALAQPDDLYAMSAPLRVPNGNRLVSVSASNEDIRQVLYDLAQRNGLNLMLADSVSGQITIELNGVPLNEALQAIAVSANLDIMHKEGNIYLVQDRRQMQDAGLNRGYSKVIKVYYSNATRLARLLNATLLNTGGSTGGTTNTVPKVMPDSRTNSLLVVGTPQEIAVAEKAVARLDKPRNARTFYLSNANAVNVASQLSSGLFNDGTAQLNVGGSGSGSSASGAGGAGSSVLPVTASTMSIERERIQEGTGINNFGGQSGSNSTAGLGQSITLRGMVKETTNMSISPEGPIIIPDTRTNSVTIMGTAEQIALAESMIPILDAQLPQVSIEVSLVEISETGRRDLGTSFGIGQGNFQLGFNNTARAYNRADASIPGSAANQQTIGIDSIDSSGNGFTGIGFTSSPVTNSKEFTTQIRALITSNKAKVLASPTVVATHDSESVISIVDEIIRRTTVEQSSSVIGLTTQEVEIGEAGIVLDILPKVGEDGTITMRLRPSVSTIRDTTQTDAFGNDVTLLSKRDLLAQSVRVQDGETIVLGGLVREEDTTIKQKTPGLSDLPIVGALFRASRRDKSRSELVLMVTPHIMNKTDLTPVNYAQSTFNR